MLFAQLVDDPSAWPKRFRGEDAQKRERERLHKLIERLVPWEASNDEAVLNEARYEIARSIAWSRDEEPPSHPEAVRQYLLDHAPPVYDPFCGGGSIPLEAQRLGLRAIASDLNPVAVMITKALIEFPPKFAGRPPVNPDARASSAHVTNETLVPHTKSEKARASSPLPSPPSRLHRGWHHRGYLPHFDAPELVQSVTFRLNDALPKPALDRIVEETTDAGERPDRIEQLRDAGHGACHLRDPRIARLVEDALLHFDGERYRLIEWVVMPNHVHVLVEIVPGQPLDRVIHSWKSFTAKAALRLLGAKAPFWQRDYFDRFIRDDAHLSAVRRYIHENPVKAGLVSKPEDWPFSSAAARASETLALHTTSETLALDKGETLASGPWKGAQGLAEDVCWYGKWMRDEAEKRIGHLYPKIGHLYPKIRAASETSRPTREKERASGPQMSDTLHTVIAWLWARTVKCPNPAARGAMVPLVSSLGAASPAPRSSPRISRRKARRSGWARG